MKHALAIMLVVETDDPRLMPEALADWSAARVSRARAAVLAALPDAVTRVIAIMPVEQAQLLMMVHEAVGKEIGAPEPLRPPPSYVPPTRD